MEHDIVSPPSGKFPGTPEQLEGLSYFSGRNVPNGNYLQRAVRQT